MRFLFAILVTILGLTACFAMPGTTASPQDIEALDKLLDGSNKFALKCYQELSKANPTENVIASPLSLQIALAMTYVGTKGETAKELETALHFPDNKDDVLRGHKMLLQTLDHPVLKIANVMFVEQTFKLMSDFQDSLAKYFFSPANQVDFKVAPEAARSEINSWVEDKTNKKIKDLLAEGTVDTRTRLVLVNAIHFKANWKYQFESRMTRELPFYTAPGRSVNVQMMHMKRHFNYKYHPELKAKFLEMPYADDEFHMVFILPDEIDGLPALEAHLSNLNLTHEVNTMSNVEVDVQIPKFKLESTMDLEDLLKKMGVNLIFKGGDLSGISESEPLEVSKVVQKAFIEVNEEGTEAAAATAFVVMSRCLMEPMDPLVFIADHPFFFAIIHSSTLLFSGSLCNPT